MEEPNLEPEIQSQSQPKPTTQLLSPSSSGRRTNNPNSPEFEFWMVRNPSFPQPNLHSADELFVDGIILPLCLLSQHSHPSNDDSHPSNDGSNPNPQQITENKNEKPISEPEPEIGISHGTRLEPEHGPGPETGPESSTTTVLSSSKRWRDIFKVGDKKSSTTNSSIQEDSRADKEKKKDRNNGNRPNNSAELNINIWPFSRSRSAGNNGTRPKLATTRKVSSAPCSRSNSGGESKSKKWPNSPSRGGGIHLGRSSPVWQVRRGGTGLKSSEQGGVRNAEKGVNKKDGPSDSNRWSKSRLGGGSGGGGGGGGVGLNLNVQMCMGYRQNSSCRTDENSSLVGRGGGEQSCSGGAAGGGGNGVKLFNLRTLFSSKKVY